MRVLWVALLTAALCAADDVPAWVRAAAAQPVPEYPVKVAAAVLLHEESVTVDPDGRQTMRERGVIKSLRKSNETIAAFRSYDTKSGRIRDFHAWLLPPTGPAVNYGKDKVVDVALSSGDTYDEGRAKVISAGTGLAPGSVFAYEVTEEEKTVFTQYSYAFQESMPVLVSRFLFTTPAGWKVRSVLFNHAAMEPVVEGGTYTWEMRGLPWIEDEKYGPDLHAVVPRLGLTYFPGENKAGLRSLEDWQAVSAWMAELANPAAAPTENIRAKSAELTAGAGSEVDKIHAIATFVQQVNYVSVQLNATRGGGYKPHPADQVLDHNYGDCKDKATLMRALLQSAGIGSYLTSIYATDRTYVQPAWASPWQFNHAIVAVKVSPGTKLPTVFEHPQLGRLLIFDPTDPDTPLGDLPEDEQGSYALINAGGSGDLTKMPLLPAASNRVESSVEAKMDTEGILDAHVARQYFGQAAARAHARMAHWANDELKRAYESSLGRRVGGIQVKRAAISGKIAEGSMQLDLEFAAQHFSRTMPGLMIIQPGVLALGADYVLAPGERKLPVKLDADMYRDTVRIKLPAALKIDEMPAPVELDSRYGTYKASWKADGADLLFEQSTEIRDMQVPAAQYDELRAFFTKIGGSQAAPVVLVTK